MTVSEMPKVTECTVDGCSYNNDGCQAFAVTVGQNAACQTFIPLDTRGGLGKVLSQVGACQRENCAHNENLECTADTVRIGGMTAECLSFEAR